MAMLDNEKYKKGVTMRSMVRVAAIACFLACFQTVMAGAMGVEDTVAAGTFSIGAMGELETAEMLKARVITPGSGGLSKQWNHSWYTHLLGTIDFAARPVSSLTLRGSFEFREYMNMSALSSFDKAYYMGDFKQSEFYIREAQGVFSLLKNESMSIELALGLMPYKYNSEVRELGEFLFRSGTYPFYLQSDFDRPFSRLTGLRASFRAGNDMFGWKIDWLALTQREIRPFYDISIAAVADLSLLRILNIGAGIDFANAFPMNDKYTTPRNIMCDVLPYPYIIYGRDSTPIGSAYYTFKGTKLMARLTMDPIGMVREDKESIVNVIAGRNGGKLYGEIAVIGLENYPRNNNNLVGYDIMNEKMPWMLGITVPMWKILDVCSFEIERYPSPLPNTTFSYMKGVPVNPFTISDNRTPAYDFTNVYRPRWYWSFYMEKQIITNFSVVCQMGRDHQRWEMPLGFTFFTYDYEEAMVKSNEWGWHIKLVVSL